MASFPVANYTVTQTGMADGYGWIMLFSAAGGSVNRARLNFVKTGVGSVTASSSMVTVAMDVNCFSRILDILRNEKPVNFSWYPTWASVYTGMEPVGEGEI